MPPDVASAPASGNIARLEPNEIFVFGSNEAGQHGGGAALQAHFQFGAELGCGEGLTGQSYAFPTLDANLKQLPWRSLVDARDRLYWACVQNFETRFLLTKVGCGIAGYEEDRMRSLFRNPPANLILPADWEAQLCR